MTDLFNSPVLVIEQPSPQPSYRITDPQGTLLATADQVGGQRKTAFQRFFSTGDTSRLVLQVSRPDGAPLFYVDRAPRQRATSPLQPPCAIMAPDGTQFGRVEHNQAAIVHNYMSASHAAHGRYGEAQAMGEIPAYRLVDGTDQPVCQLTPEPVRYKQTRTGHRPTTIGGRFFTYTDMKQVPIARLDNDQAVLVSERVTLNLQYRLPDPLRVLVIASPLAIDVMVTATYGGP